MEIHNNDNAVDGLVENYSLCAPRCQKLVCNLKYKSEIIPNEKCQYLRN